MLTTANLQRHRRELVKQREAEGSTKRVFTVNGWSVRHFSHKIAVTGQSTEFCDVMPDGAWFGQRCFIIGGGPSLTGFDVSRLRGELVIGVNRAYEKIDPAISFSMDNRFYCWANGGRFGMESRDKWINMNGSRVFSRIQKEAYGRDFYTIDRKNGPMWSTSLKDGIVKCTNSGLSAINLAMCLGANPIYLLGFDLAGAAGSQAWWHNGYPAVQKDTVYSGTMLPDFQHFAPQIKAMGARVINLNPTSALRCFEFGDFEELEPRPPMPMVIGYYTVDTGYEREAREMVKSAHRMGLDHEVQGIASLGSWQKNTQYKARFVRHMLDRHPGRDLVYVDADARFRRFPSLFSRLGKVCDIAYHRLNGEFLSGTVFFANNPTTRDVVDRWIAECEANPGVWDQKCLDAAQAGRCDAFELPPEYCRIFDHRTQGGAEAPVIEHLQASRRLKAEVGQ